METFNCKLCNKEFKRYRRTGRGVRCCSRKCLYQSNKKQIGLICLYCNKQFSDCPGHLRRGRGKYCSRKCCNLAQDKKTYRNCLVCNKEFFVTPSKLKNKRHGLYCSKSCVGFTRIGEKGLRWQGGITALNDTVRSLKRYEDWRQIVLTRDGHRCIWCGVGTDLHVDHIKPFARLLKELNIRDSRDAIRNDRLWDTENGRVLCFKCHKTTESYAGRTI